MVSRDIPEPYAVLRGNMGPLYCEYDVVDVVDVVDIVDEDAEDVEDCEDAEDCEDDDVGEGVPDKSPIDRDLGPWDTGLTVASSVKYDGTPEFGNLECLGDLHTRIVDLVSNDPQGPTNPSVGRTRPDNKPPDLVSNNPKGPTNPSVGRTRSDNKPPDIKQILAYPDCLNYINGRSAPISNESKSPTNPSLGRTRSDNKPPDIEIILDDPESLNYINGRPNPISNESKSPTNPSLGRTRSDNKPPDIEIILDDPESLNYINGRPDPISNESKSPANPSLGRTRSDNKPPDIEIILDDPESLHYVNGRPDPESLNYINGRSAPISNESKGPPNPSLGRGRPDNKPPDKLGESVDVLPEIVDVQINDDFPPVKILDLGLDRFSSSNSELEHRNGVTFKVKLSVNGINLSAVVDSGAQLTILRRD